MPSKKSTEHTHGSRIHSHSYANTHHHHRWNEIACRWKRSVHHMTHWKHKIRIHARTKLLLIEIHSVYYVRCRIGRAWKKSQDRNDSRLGKSTGVRAPRHTHSIQSIGLWFFFWGAVPTYATTGERTESRRISRHSRHSREKYIRTE